MLNFKLPKELPKTVSVVSISCGQKFMITKTSNVEWLTTEIKKVLGKYLRGGVLEINFFYPLVRYINRTGEDVVKIEVLFYSENGYDILKFELEQLQEFFGTPGCLNANNIPHIPKTVIAKKGSNWLTQNQALNFRKLLTKYDY